MPHYSRKPRYTTRLPSLLRDFLTGPTELWKPTHKIHDGDFQSFRRVRQMFGGLPIEGRMEIRHKILKNLTGDGRTEVVWRLITYYLPNDQRVRKIANRAARIGNLELLMRMSWAGKVIWPDVAYHAARYNHMDVVSMFIPSFASGSSVFISDEARLATVSLHMLQVHLANPRVAIPHEALRNSAVSHCLRYGFDKELLDHFHAFGSNLNLHPPEAIFGNFDTPKLHNSALETIRYLLEKYPNVNWGALQAYGAIDLIKDPAIRQQTKDLLAAHGLLQ